MCSVDEMEEAENERSVSISFNEQVLPMGRK